MKFFLMFLLAGISVLSAAEQGSPDIIHWRGDTVEKKVLETGRLEVFATGSTAPADKHSCADRIADHGKRFVWVPTEDNSRGAGGAKIPDVAVSPDKSALFMLETVGDDEGPFDTRLVILNTRTGNIIRVSRFAKVRYSRILPLPDADELLLAEAPDQGKQRIIRLDPVSGKILSAVRVPTFSDWIVQNGFLLIKSRENRNLWIGSCLNLARLVEVQTAAPGGKLVPESEWIVNNIHLDPAVKLERIALPGAAKIHDDEVFRKMPENFAPESGQWIKTSRNAMQLWMEPGGLAMLKIGETFHRLADRVTGSAAYHPESGTLFIGLQKRDMLAEFLPEQSLNMRRTSLTGQLRPRTPGEIRLFFCPPTQHPEVMILDHRANFYRLQVPLRGRSWKKTILFTPGK